MNEEKSADLAAITNGAEEAITNATGITDLIRQENGGVTTTSSLRPRRQKSSGPKKVRVLTPTRPVTVRNTLGIPWSTARTSIDNAKSRKWGLALRQAMNAQGIADFQRGDHVKIHVGVGARSFELIGRASRPSTAYFWIDECMAEGVGLHEVINVIIASVHPAGASTTTDGGAQ